MNNEYKALTDKQTWEVVIRPKNANTVINTVNGYLLETRFSRENSETMFTISGSRFHTNFQSQLQQNLLTSCLIELSENMLDHSQKQLAITSNGHRQCVLGKLYP